MAFILAKASGTEIFPPVVPCPSRDQGLLCWSSPLRAPMSCDSHLGPIQTLTVHSACSNMSHHLGSYAASFSSLVLSVASLLPSHSRFKPNTLYGSRQKPTHFLPHPRQRQGFLSFSLLNAELLDGYWAKQEMYTGRTRDNFLDGKREGQRATNI